MSVCNYMFSHNFFLRRIVDEFYYAFYVCTIRFRDLSWSVSAHVERFFVVRNFFVFVFSEFILR